MKKWCVVAALLIVMAWFSSTARAVEHDHRDWNMVNVGRMVAIARIDAERCNEENGGVLGCSMSASEEAVAKLTALMDLFQCRAIGEKSAPTIDHRGPLTKYDHGPLVIAELGDVHCSLTPRRQLFPVEPQEFVSLCSQIEWKCDAIWISDGDDSVWHINKMSDLRR